MTRARAGYLRFVIAVGTSTGRSARERVRRTRVLEARCDVLVVERFGIPSRTFRARPHASSASPYFTDRRRAARSWRSCRYRSCASALGLAASGADTADGLSMRDAIPWSALGP
jgi:hypothetical protein